MKITAKNFEKYLRKYNINYTKNEDNLTVGGGLDLQGTNIKNSKDVKNLIKTLCKSFIPESKNLFAGKTENTEKLTVFFVKFCQKKEIS